MHPFHAKLLYQKPMLRQKEWRVRNGTITNNRVLLVTTLFFWTFCFNLRTSYKRLISCTNDPNAHFRTFCKHWSFIWRYFFSVSILKKQCSEIEEMSLFSKWIVLTNLEYLTDILMCFFLGKFISEIHEYSQKSEKFNSSLWMHILLLAIHTI